MNGQSPGPDYSIVNYNGDNALPQNSINNMAFDRNGFLWLATEMGIVRFDGRNFREYNMANTPAMQSNRCSVIAPVTSSGKILIFSHRILTVTADYQLKEDSTWSVYPHQYLGNNHIFSFANLYTKWANDDSLGGLFDRYDLKGDLLTVNESQAYVRKERSYYYLDNSTAEIHLLTGITGHAPKIQFMVGDVCVYVDSDNRLYAYRKGRLQNISGSRRLMQLLGEVAVNGPYPIQASLKVLRDTCHTFLVHKGDILILSLRPACSSGTQGSLLDFDTLAANTPIRNINCLIYDQQYKTIYAGTATSGLYILKKREFKRLGFSSDNYVINSLYAQVELSDKKILTSSGILDPRARMNSPSPGAYDRAAFLQSSDGHIWYSDFGWLKRSDTGLHKVDNITSLGSIAYFGIWLSAIVETDNKDILCSTQYQLFRVRGKTPALLFDTRTSLNKAEIMTIRTVTSNDLWIGTNAGIYSYDLSRGTICPVHGLDKATVRAIYKARDGSIWIGTYGQGFYTWRNGRFLRMPMDPANNLATVHCFMEDKQGHFWLPTNKGLFRVSKHELDSFASGEKDEVYYYYFDKTAGFATNEFNGGCTPCGIVTRDGLFSLPSLDGLVQFDPDSVTIIPPNHPIFIERVTGDDKKVLPPGYFQQDQEAGPLIFSVASPYFGNPTNLHLEYAIRQLDNKWHALPADGRLVLTGLHKGHYDLTIRKQEGNTKYSYSTVNWYILPYWYETIAFRLATALLLISILPVIFWLRYTRQVKRSGQLEQKVTERTAALAESNRVKEKMISIILHDLRSPLRFLHMLAGHVYEKHKTIPEPVLDDMLLKFQNATHELCEFAQDFVVWSNVQKEGFVVQQEEIVLRETVAEIAALYKTGADLRNNVVLNQVPEAITLTSDPYILKVIIRNLTDNANKYTHNGEIRIEAAQNDSATCITITDTGRSMDRQLITDILDNTYGTDNDSNGFGYKIITELLTRIRGELNIDTPGTIGNRVTLLFKN